ncbi:hypothetical protein BH23CHL8_BH23CHL8_16290 [soil metagenome]
MRAYRRVLQCPLVAKIDHVLSGAAQSLCRLAGGQELIAADDGCHSQILQAERQKHNTGLRLLNATLRRLTNARPPALAIMS